MGRYVLSIGGFDPCCGAGVVADAKVFDRFGLLGLCALSCFTVQVEDRFVRSEWVGRDAVMEVVELLFDRYPICGVKIGMSRSLDELLFYVSVVRRLCGCGIPVVVDPVVRPSALVSEAGSGFEGAGCWGRLGALAPGELNGVIFTPNRFEAEELFGSLEGVSAACALTGCSVVVTGCRGVDGTVWDWVWSVDGGSASFAVPAREGDKHGTGCIYSSVVLSGLVLGDAVSEAVQRAQQYVFDYVGRGEGGLLGLHADPYGVGSSGVGLAFV